MNSIALLQIICFIDRYSRENSFPPTIREIMAGVGKRSYSGVKEALAKLEENGYLTSRFHQPRTLVLTDRGKYCASESAACRPTS